MPRTLSLDESRDAKIAELTERNLLARRAMLRAGDPVVAAAVGASVAVRFSNELMDELCILSERDPQAMQDKFKDLVGKVLRDEAEVDAVRDIEQMERQRAPVHTKTESPC